MTMRGKNGSTRRVVVTGMGIISPVGNDVSTMWDNLLAGRSGGGPVTHWDATEDFACRIACEVKGFEPLDYLEKRDVRRHDRVSQFSVAASAQALESAGLTPLPEGVEASRVGVVFGSGI